MRHGFLYRLRFLNMNNLKRWIGQRLFDGFCYRFIELCYETLIIIVIFQFFIHLVIFFHTSSKNYNFNILSKSVVRRNTPYYLYFWIKTVKEIVYFLHLRYHYRHFIARIDIKKYAFGMMNITAIYQRRFQSSLYGMFYTLVSACSASSHDSAAAITHSCLHITKIEHYTTITIDCYQFRDTYYSIFQYVVGTGKSIFDRNWSVSVNITQTLIIYYKNSIDILAQFVNATQSLYDFCFFLKIERYGNNTNGE